MIKNCKICNKEFKAKSPNNIVCADQKCKRKNQNLSTKKYFKSEKGRMALRKAFKKQYEKNYVRLISIELIKDVYPFLNHELNHLTKENDINKVHKLFEDNKTSIRHLINGNFKTSIDKLQILMKKHANNLEFEEANNVKLKLDSLKNYQSKSTVVNSKITNVDVFSIISDESYAYVNFFQVAFGSIIRSHTLEIKKKTGRDRG